MASARADPAAGWLNAPARSYIGLSAVARETLAACDTAHEAMAESMTSMTEQDRAQHGAHHGTTES